MDVRFHNFVFSLVQMVDDTQLDCKVGFHMFSCMTCIIEECEQDLSYDYISLERDEQSEP